MSRKKFIESEGATCCNWTWSWSFINEKEKFVIFGAWNVHKQGNKALILDEEWATNSQGRRQPGYTQALEHIHLVECGEYTLRTFPMIYSDEMVGEDGTGPAKIKDFVPKLEVRRVLKEGGKWFAVG